MRLIRVFAPSDDHDAVRGTLSEMEVVSIDWLDTIPGLKTLRPVDEGGVFED